MDRHLFQDVILPLVANPDPLPTIDFMKDNGLLKSSLECPACAVACKWVNRNGTKDGFGSRCMNKNCNRYKSYLSLRSDSFFAKSKISLQNWLHLMYLWCNNERQDQAVNTTGISKQAMVDVFNFFREVCAVYFQQNPIQLGGPGVICQIDESQFQSKPKHHRGRQLHGDAIWVFGIVDITATPAVGYMEIGGRWSCGSVLHLVHCHLDYHDTHFDQLQSKRII